MLCITVNMIQIPGKCKAAAGQWSYAGLVRWMAGDDARISYLALSGQNFAINPRFMQIRMSMAQYAVPSPRVNLQMNVQHILVTATLD